MQAHLAQRAYEEELLPWIRLKRLEAVLAMVLVLEIHLYHPVQYGFKTEDPAVAEVTIKIHKCEFLLFQLHGGV